MDYRELLDDLDYLSGTYGAATLTDSEAKTLVHSDWGDELDIDLNVIARHYHLDTFWESDLTGNIQCADEELRTILVVEWSVATTFLFLEDVDLSLELCMRSDGTWLGNNLTSLDFLLVDTTEEKTYVITGLTLIKELAEHLNACADRCSWLLAETYELNRIVNVNCTLLDTSGNYGTTTSDGEDVLDRHKERLIGKTNWKRNVSINSVHKFHYLLLPLWFTVKCAKG